MNAAKKLNISLYFGIRYSHTFNASAKIKNNSSVILFNLGLINKIETIISDSVKFFMLENISAITIRSTSKEKLEIITRNCCLAYIFYHELAHIIQLLELNSKREYYLREKYSNIESFEVRNHIYEIDADNFGSYMSGYILLESIMSSDYKFEPMILFNSLTLLLFTISNTIIEFSGYIFQDLYYKENSHPHPFIRIVKCNEQILSFISKNLNIPSELFEAVLQRMGSMVSQITYSDGRKVDYHILCRQNFQSISDYIDEIENLDQHYKELTRHKSHIIFDSLLY